MSNIKLFEDNKVRTQWDDTAEKWWFSVYDVVAILTEQPDFEKVKNYWKWLKNQLKKEGSELVSQTNQLKLESHTDGKFYNTDVLDTEGIFRLVQSIPSKKAEPFKVWLAKVATERIEEITDPEIAFKRAAETYLKKGYSREWINQRILSIEMRNELTGEWKASGVSSDREYAILTDEMTQAWSGKSVKGYKKHKDVKAGNLRDNMTNLELVLNMLAEVSATEISRDERPSGFSESLGVAKRGGSVARVARESIESQLGRSVISTANASDKLALDESPKTLGISSPLKTDEDDK
jgi:hypothetical protein